MRASVPLVIFLCCFTDINKNGINDWKITKISAKIQWRSFIRSWVIRLWFLHMYYIFMLFQKIIKTEQTTEKAPNFQQILLNIWASFSQNFNAVALFLLELSGLVFYIYTIFLCCFLEINKNGTNNWKITKLSANTF